MSVCVCMSGIRYVARAALRGVASVCVSWKKATFGCLLLKTPLKLHWSTLQGVNQWIFLEIWEGTWHIELLFFFFIGLTIMYKR